MKTIYHHWICPFSRKVRIALSEKKQKFVLKLEAPWINPEIEIPTLKEDDGREIYTQNSICEYIDEAYPEPPLYGNTPIERAEVRRLVNGFDNNFYETVTTLIVGEKLYKRIIETGTPDSRVLSTGRENLHIFMGYMDSLIEKRRWLAGKYFSMADITAAAHFSLLDYIDEVPWEKGQIQ